MLCSLGEGGGGGGGGGRGVLGLRLLITNKDEGKKQASCFRFLLLPALFCDYLTTGAASAQLDSHRMLFLWEKMSIILGGGSSGGVTSPAFVVHDVSVPRRCHSTVLSAKPAETEHGRAL